jgi:hypothetical protein
MGELSDEDAIKHIQAGFENMRREVDAMLDAGLVRMGFLDAEERIKQCLHPLQQLDRELCLRVQEKLESLRRETGEGVVVEDLELGAVRVQWPSGPRLDLRVEGEEAATTQRRPLRRLVRAMLLPRAPLGSHAFSDERTVSAELSVLEAHRECLLAGKAMLKHAQRHGVAALRSFLASWRVAVTLSRAALLSERAAASSQASQASWISLTEGFAVSAQMSRANCMRAVQLAILSHDARSGKSVLRSWASRARQARHLIHSSERMVLKFQRRQQLCCIRAWSQFVKLSRAVMLESDTCDDQMSWMDFEIDDLARRAAALMEDESVVCSLGSWNS